MPRLQAIFCDSKPSTKHEQTLDNLFAGEQSGVVCEKLVLVVDNFDVLAAHCKQVRNSTADCHEVMWSAGEHVPNPDTQKQRCQKLQYLLHVLVYLHMPAAC